MKSAALSPSSLFRALLLCALSLLFAGSRLAAATDAEIIAAFKVESARIQTEMAGATDDLTRMSELQRELKALITRTLEQVSEKTRPAIQVGLEIMGPLMEDGMVYTKMVQNQIEADLFNYATATTTEIIERRLKSLKELETFNSGLARRLSTIDADVQAVLRTSKLSKGEQTSFLEGFRKSSSAKLAAQRAVRTLDTLMFAEIRATYDQLREQMGKWSVQDGEVIFQDPEQVTAYNQRMTKIGELAERQEKAQRQALGVPAAPQS